MTPAQRLAAWTAALDLEAIPAAVAEAAKLHLLDALGCGLAAHALGVATAARALALESGGRAESSVIGAAPLPAASAAFANGMLCHGLDYDDTHSDAVCHVSAVMAPAAVAAAEAAGAGGAELLAALVAGNEIAARIGMAAPAAFHRRGFHPTSVCGVFGAAAAAARLRGLDARATAQALGIAGSLAGGIFEYLADGSQTKPIHAAAAARDGIVAAGLAAHGATGPATVLEGRFGLFAAFADRHAIDLEPALADLGRRWETPRIAFKPYPACHYVHAPLDAAVQAVAGQPIDPEQIAEIVVRVPEPAVALVLEPAADKARPRTPYDAKFSLPYSVAARLVRGSLGLDAYRDDAISDPRVLSLARRVRYEVVPFATFPKAFPGGARVRLVDGRVLAAELPYQRGGPENPMAADEVRAKFRANARLALDDDQFERLEAAILALESAGDVRPVFAAVSSLSP
ncbi:MAG: MmgE/PrpD family protein [Deltaproteobacteria bacterium]|nr:MmgE/PrpD family protein [Deltaproteobacteria bacterium]